jgi:hypothetical protein
MKQRQIKGRPSEKERERDKSWKNLDIEKEGNTGREKK